MNKTIMKKILTAVLVITALMMTTTLNAQDKPVTFGVKAGLNLSNMNVEGFDIKPGFNVGVTVDLRLMPNLYILSGLEYSLEGAKFGGFKGEFIKVDDAKLNLSYLKMPIHIGYKLPVLENLKIVFQAGPHLAYAVDGKMKWGSESLNIYDDKAEFADSTNRFDIGLGFGVGAEVSNFCFNVGCDFGLINQIEEESTLLAFEAKNQNINISVGYKF